MNIKYEYISSTKAYSKEYNLIDEFLKEHPLWTQLLSDGREEQEMNIRIINKDIPFTINIELYK
jgi:hypothetical protein